MSSMSGVVVLITGASTGIGQATAEAFADEGAKVILVARAEGRLQRIRSEIEARGGVAVSMPADITDRDSVTKMVDHIIQTEGHIDVLVNNAGIGLLSPVEDMDPVELERVFEVNFFGLVRCTQAVLPYMIKQNRGNIINISSVAGKRAVPHISAYCASKFAVQGFSDSLRMEVGQRGITVTVVCPPRVDTTFHDTPLMRRKGQRMKVPSISAAVVAGEIVKAAKKGSSEVIISFYGKFFVYSHKFAPRLLDWFMERLWSRLSSKKIASPHTDDPL